VVRAAHGADLVGALHGAGAFGDDLAFQHVEPGAFERAEAVDHDLVDGEPAVVARMGAHHLLHLPREGAGVRAVASPQTL
jgi:hypothetical protein